MLKVIVGSAIGGLVAGGIAVVAAGQARENPAPAVAVPYGTAMPAMTQPVTPALACAPHQEVAVARVIVNGAEAATLTCVDRVPPGYVVYPQAGLAPQAPFVSTVPVAVQPMPVRAAPAATCPFRAAGGLPVLRTTTWCATSRTCDRSDARWQRPR